MPVRQVGFDEREALVETFLVLGMPIARSVAIGMPGTTAIGRRRQGAGNGKLYLTFADDSVEIFDIPNRRDGSALAALAQRLIRSS